MDFHDNELKQNQFLTDRFAEIFQAMGAQQIDKEYRKGPYDITQYQTTHLSGGAVMGRIRAPALSIATCKAGTSQPLRHGSERFSAKRGIQPHGHRRGARVLVGGGDQDPVSQESGTAGSCVTAPGA